VRNLVAMLIVENNCWCYIRVQARDEPDYHQPFGGFLTFCSLASSSIVTISSAWNFQYLFNASCWDTNFSFALAASDFGENPVSFIDSVSILVLDSSRHGGGVLLVKLLV